jgi:hypothetical protein
LSKFSALKEHLLKHGSLYTSVASVAIALMALLLTVYSAWLDRQYKELSIRPFLHLHVETSDFHVGFLNAGLGPAEIKLVAMKFNPPQCVFLFQRQQLPADDPTQLGGKLVDLLKPIDAYFADPLAQLVVPVSVWDPPKTPKLYTRTLTPGQIIPAGQEENIFELQKETLEVVQQKLQTLKSDEYNSILRRFVARARAIPYYLNFCSLTGDYCVNQVDVNCNG